MLGPLNIDLGSFDVSPRFGFLPDEVPLQRMNEPYYQDWEVIIDQLPLLLRQKTIRNVVDQLAVLSTSRLCSERQWRRAYVLLSFITHAYIWGGNEPSDRLPASISVPFLVVSQRLGLPPTATAAALVLWNFTSGNPDRTKPEHLSIPHTFTGTRDEEWFYIITLVIEARGAHIIPVMLEAMDAVRVNDSEVVSRCLFEFADCVYDIKLLLQRMYEECAPDVFYHQIRPLLAGSKNMGAAGLPKGVFYEDGKGSGEWHQHSGGSNAQSSLIQFLDIVLGVEHFHTKPSNAGTDAAKQKGGFLEEMREYMPGGHRRFLQKIESLANIRDYAQNSASGEKITAAYNLAVAQVGALRDTHIQIVTRYIIGPSRKPSKSANTGVGVNLAIASTNRKSVEGMPGTGGTELMPFLKQSRDETKETAIS